MNTHQLAQAVPVRDHLGPVLISSYFRNKQSLSAEMRGSIEQHLEGCERCRKDLRLYSERSELYKMMERLPD